MIFREKRHVSFPRNVINRREFALARFRLYLTMRCGVDIPDTESVRVSSVRKTGWTVGGFIESDSRAWIRDRKSRSCKPADILFPKIHGEVRTATRHDGLMRSIECHRREAQKSAYRRVSR